MRFLSTSLAFFALSFLVISLPMLMPDSSYACITCGLTSQTVAGATMGAASGMSCWTKR
eukprot:CAMPEP_0117499560 /NCGR_PEP_ID=MMETSP0784-20121206/22308_1 /TAXON_ID=39447 /ORGANISM="" /LENGTH=58 /DNA_ID=CAMNT_0005294711 /DNA_START=166 /DNA_END=338 /DNA_ORIENTATION=+